MADAPVKAPETDRLVRVSELPPNLQWAVSRLSPEDRHLVETCLCRMPFTRDLVEVLRFGDLVWNQARNAEYRASDKRITGSEMDAFRVRMDAAIHALMGVNVELAQRTGLTEIMQRYRRLLARHGYRIGPAKNSQRPPVTRPPATPPAESRPDAGDAADEAAA
jgi:hypothetical protein